MRSAELREIVGRWMVALWQEGDVEAVDRLHAPGFVDRSPAGWTPDNEGYKVGLRQIWAAFPDMRWAVDDLVIDPEQGKVAIRASGTGTHLGPFLGVEPTGRGIAFRAIDIVRIEDGLVVERWGEWDGLDLLRQLAPDAEP